MRKTMVAVLAAFTMGAFAAGDVDARTLKVQASSKSGDWAHRFMTEGWQQKVGIMSSGSIELEVLPTKAVVPHRETIDAVANGILDGDLNAVSYFAGRDPAFGIIGDLIAGYDTPEQVRTFCQEGGGKEVLQKLYDKHADGQIHVIGCGPYAKEAFVSTKPIRGVADFKGIKLRSPEGLAADVFRKAGARPPRPRCRSPRSTPRLRRAWSTPPTRPPSSTTKHMVCTRSPSSRSIRASTPWPCCSSS
jgi:TRAP-type C4-dicarboxylate transport system substrate-binding protein